MKISKLSAIASSAVLSLMLASCGGEDEEVVPEISPAKKAEAQKPVPAEKQDSLPELQSIQSLSADTASARGTFSTAGSDLVKPGASGSITIQVSIQPSKHSAKAILQKLADNGIQGYIAQVENPGELEGSYYRVRVGYFKKLEEANKFGKNALEPLGFAWWIDNKANDYVGAPESGETASSYKSTDSYNTAGSYTASPSEENSKEKLQEQPVAEPMPVEAPEAAVQPAAPVEQPATPTVQPAIAPVEQPATAPTEQPAAAKQTAPAQAEPATPATQPVEDDFDDWE